MTDPPELRTDGPHSDAYTIQVARQIAEAVRVLNHATGPHAAAGLAAPATVYDVLGATKTAALRLPQLFDQLAWFLGGLLDAGRLADHVREPAAAVATAQTALGSCRETAHVMARELERVQAATNGLYIPDTGDGSGGETR